VFICESGSVIAKNSGLNQSKLVNISENVFAINHLKKKNLERVQGKQDDQVFTSNLRIKVNNIVKNVLLALNYYDGNINEW
jgi:hypothetical protein